MDKVNALWAAILTAENEVRNATSFRESHDIGIALRTSLYPDWENACKDIGITVFPEICSFVPFKKAEMWDTNGYLIEMAA